MGPLLVDGAARRVTGAGGERHLTRTEFDLLWALARRAGEVVDRTTLLVEALRGRRSPRRGSRRRPPCARSTAT